MDQGLLVRLRSYRPGQNRDSLENFVTEAFRWLIESTVEVEQAFLEKLRKEGGLADWLTPIPAMQWATQESLGTKRPDMVARSENLQLIFEHKVWAALGDNQLQNYRQLGSEYYPTHHTAIVLITPTSADFSDEADITLTWAGIYEVLEPLLDTLSDVSAQRVNEFLALLAHEGLGPPAPISHAALTYYAIGRTLPQQLSDVFAQLAHLDWPLSADYSVQFKGYRWGRVGIEFYRRSGGVEWAPGFFLGCVLDGRDHGIEERWETSQLQLIVDMEGALHRHYPTMDSYKKLIAFFDAIASRTAWQCYDHLADASSRKANKYHPLYLETPLIALLQGTQQLDEQVEALRESVMPVLSEVADSACLQSFMAECDRSSN